MNAEELMEMTEQSHNHKPTDDLSYEERVWWMRGFNSGWIARGARTERGTDMAYKTECPECGSSMNVVQYRVTETSRPLTEDGFGPMDAKSYSTDGEWVVCSNEDCDFESDLEYLEEV